MNLERFKKIDWMDPTLEDVLALCDTRQGLGVIAPFEVINIWEINKKYRFKNIVEIGRRNGRSTILFSIIAKKYDGYFTSIDSSSSKEILETLNSLGLNDVTTLVEEKSPLRRYRFDKEIDFLFIDGDHTFINVIVDYYYFNYFLMQGGLIWFHDLQTEEIKRAIDEICKQDRLKKILLNEEDIGLYQKIGR